MSESQPTLEQPADGSWPRRRRLISVAVILALLVASAGGWRLYRRSLALNGLGTSPLEVGRGKGTFRVSRNQGKVSNVLGFEKSAPEFVYEIAGYKTMAWLQTPTRLAFAGEVTDEDLIRYAETTPEIRDLWLWNTQLSNEGLACLPAFRSARQLILMQRKGASANDDGLIHLRSLRDLNGLTLSGPEFGDEGMKHVGTLTSLRQLEWHGPRLTDSGMQYLSGLTELRGLFLGAVNVRGEGLKSLSELSQLRVLSLKGTQVESEYFRHLADHPRLELLIVERNKVTDWNGLQHLKLMPALTNLNLSESAVNDDGVRHLAGFDRLEGLNLNGTAVTDASISTLMNLKGLRSISLHDTAVTPGAAFRLLAERPDLRVGFPHVSNKE